MKNLCELHPRLEELTGNLSMLLGEFLQGSREMSSIRRISDIEASPSESGDEWSFVGLKAGF